MADKVTTGLLKSAFGSGTKKGPKKGEGSGDTQHGELANDSTPKKVTKTKGARAGEKKGAVKPAADDVHDLSKNGAAGGTKPSARVAKRVGDHATKAVLPVNDYGLHDMSKNGAKMEAPMDKVMRHAHQAKVAATRDWVEGRKTSEEHDEVHRRANAVLKTKGRRP